MSLTKLLTSPIKLFRKNVITFLLIRRYDLGIIEEGLRYVSVKPSASIFVLRQKVWHLLDLPDFCEEIIVLKSNDDTIIPLTELRNGNDPQHPYILEVWLPGNYNMLSSTSIPHNNMLTIGNGDEKTPFGNRALSSDTIFHVQAENIEKCNGCTCFSQTTVSNETATPFNKVRMADTKRQTKTFLTDFRKSEISCRISSTSLFKISGKKSRDNFANILLKIQSDLSTLSNKLTVLENRLPS